MNKNELENGIEEISDDVDDIAQDTDTILKHIGTLLIGIESQQKAILQAIEVSKQNKKWIQGLFIVDKVIMFLMFLASAYIGATIL